jgi:hypothetical protein
MFRQLECSAITMEGCSMRKRGQRFGLIVLLCITSVLSMATPASAGPTTEDFVFGRWLGHWDLPVINGVVARTWIWGPLTGPIREANWGRLPVPGAEPYDGQLRPVMYFDKARMEIPNLDAAEHARPEDDPWLVTTGLLATELITGQLQLGDTTFERHEPAQIPVAGDLDSTLAPTYADLTRLLAEAPIPASKAVNQTLDSEGTIGLGARYTDYGVTAVDVGSPTNHSVASAFWEFMTSSGTVMEFVAELEGDDYVVDRLFPNPFYATGYPITEPYWTQAVVGGTERDVLLQCFERRCLTYTPGNPDGWKVEFGNIGLHYFDWRYLMIPTEAWHAPAVTLALQAQAPQTDGASAVWRDEWDGGIYTAQFGGSPVLVTAGDRQPQSPDIDGDTVVWAEEETPGGECCSANIMGANLTTGQSLAIATTTAYETAPSIDGNWVAWVQFEPDAGGLTVMARDLSTMADPIPLAQQNVASTRRPAIDDGRVVWMVTVPADDGTTETDELWMVTIGGEPELLAEAESGQIESYDIGGDSVVYTTAIEGSIEQTIHVRNLSTGDDQALPISGRAVATDGRYIAFQANGASQPEGDLVVFNLATGAQHQIAEHVAFLPWLDLTDGTLVIQAELGSSVRHAIIGLRLDDLGLH